MPCRLPFVVPSAQNKAKLKKKCRVSFVARWIAFHRLALAGQPIVCIIHISHLCPDVIFVLAILLLRLFVCQACSQSRSRHPTVS
jgi:uncharacterized membrane protein YesL